MKIGRKPNGGFPAFVPLHFILYSLVFAFLTTASAGELQAGVSGSGQTFVHDSGPTENVLKVHVLLTAAEEVILSSRLQGTINDLAVTHGAGFAQGDPLVSFDCSEQSARLAMSQAELAAARESYTGKLRMQALQQASEVDVALAASGMSRAVAQVDLYQAQLDQCTIKAPFNGHVVKIIANPYESVNQGQPLLEVVADGPLKLRLNVPVSHLSWIKKGTTFSVITGNTSKEYEAAVSALNSRVDAVSQTMEIEAALLDNHSELLPGRDGTAIFQIPEQ